MQIFFDHAAFCFLCSLFSRLMPTPSSGARWNWELAVKPRVKFRQIWVFTAKFLKIKVFRQKSVSKMHFLQRIIALLAVPPHFSPPSGDWIPPVLSYLAVNSAIWHRWLPVRIEVKEFPMQLKGIFRAQLNI